MGSQFKDAKTDCPHCGQSRSGKERFCLACGQQLELARNPDSAGWVPPPGDQVLQQPPPAPSTNYGQFGYGYPPPAPRPAKRGWQIGAIAGVLVLGCVTVFVVIVALSMRNFTEINSKAREAECKQNLHAIQLGVERFCVDHNAAYPEYLIGGEGRYADSPFPMPNVTVLDCADRGQLSDPLLREGYIQKYPQNPFAKETTIMLGLHTQQFMPMMCDPEDRGTPDPLGNGTPEGKTAGTRFGAEFTTMGQVLAEPRYPVWADPLRPGLEHDSYANVGYDMWDKPAGTEEFMRMPGQFFYKSQGELTAADVVAGGYGESKPLQPKRVGSYLLGAYGAARNKGKDCIGDEQALTGFILPSGAPAPPVWPWTRSIDSAQERAGSPYSIDQLSNEIMYYNPNGIPDGLILILAAGVEPPDE